LIAEFPSDAALPLTRGRGASMAMGQLQGTVAEGFATSTSRGRRRDARARERVMVKALAPRGRINCGKWHAANDPRCKGRAALGHGHSRTRSAVRRGDVTFRNRSSAEGPPRRPKRARGLSIRADKDARYGHVAQSLLPPAIRRGGGNLWSSRRSEPDHAAPASRRKPGTKGLEDRATRARSCQGAEDARVADLSGGRSGAGIIWLLLSPVRNAAVASLGPRSAARKEITIA